MNNPKTLFTILQPLLEILGHHLGAAVCNDWEIENTDENLIMMDEIFEYGIKWNLWDREARYHISKDRKWIRWSDFMLLAYVQRRVEDMLSKEEQKE